MIKKTSYRNSGFKVVNFTSLKEPLVIIHIEYKR